MFAGLDRIAEHEEGVRLTRRNSFQNLRPRTRIRRVSPPVRIGGEYKAQKGPIERRSGGWGDCLGLNSPVFRATCAECRLSLGALCHNAFGRIDEIESSRFQRACSRNDDEEGYKRN
jgi:hypothetical protein